MNVNQVSSLRCRAHLASNSTLEQDRLIVVDELEILQNLDPLLVIGQQLEVLFTQSHAKSALSESQRDASVRARQPVTLRSSLGAPARRVEFGTARSPT